MGGIENFCLGYRKTKYPVSRYIAIQWLLHIYQYFTEKFTKLFTFRVLCNYWVMENICLSNKLSNFANVLWLLVTVLIVKFQIHKPYWCVNLQWKFKEIVTWNFLKITFIMYHNCSTYTFKCLLLAESCFTGRAYIGELLMQIWLKSMKK